MMDMRSIVVIAGLLAAATATASPLDPSQLDVIRAATIERGLEQPGQYPPANAFDRDPSTEFCGAANQPAFISVAISDEDADVLADLVAIEVATRDTDRRALNVQVGYRRDRFSESKELAAIVEGSATQVAYHPGAEQRVTSISFDLRPVGSATGLSCITGVTFIGPRGPLDLPDIASAVARSQVRTGQLTAMLFRPRDFVTTYLTTTTWLHLPGPHVGPRTFETVRFYSDGTFERWPDATFHGQSERGRWSLDRDGVTIRAKALTFTLGACPSPRGFLCSIGGERMFPSAAG